MASRSHSAPYNLRKNKEQNMLCCQAVTIKTLLWLERLASAAVGQHNEIAALHHQDQDGLLPHATLATTTTPLSWMRRIALLIGLLIVVALESIYYIVHFLASDEDLMTMARIWIVDFICLAFFLSYFFAAPVHRTLLHTRDPQESQRILMTDKNTSSFITLSSLCFLLYAAGDFYYFGSRLEMEVLVQTAYVVGLCINIATMYAALLLTILAVRVILNELSEVEEEIDNELEQATTAGQYDTFNVEEGSTARVTPNGKWNAWMSSYRRIRHSMHDLSERFGPRMFGGIFFFLIDISTGISTAFGNEQEGDDGLREEMSLLDMVMIFFVFVANATMLSVTVFNLGFTVTKCVHHIGPKLSMLSMTSPDRAVYRAHALASTFILAPIRVHIGNFEFSPEYANFVALWLLALFLLVLGLKAPASE